GVGIVLGIGRERQRDHLSFIAEAFREQRAAWTIDLPAGQDFAFAGAPFALNEAAGDASAGVGVFAVINRQREEINSFAGFGVGASGGQHHVIGEAHDDRAVC